MDASKFGPTSSAPFQIRLDKSVNDLLLKTQNILEVIPFRVPPWLIPKTKLCQKAIVKINTSDHMIKALFLEHDEVHDGEYKIYSDGSISSKGVGFAVVADDFWDFAKLFSSALIYTAIINAMFVAYHTNQQSFVIYSDSKSALERMNNYNSSHPLVQKAQEWLFWISCRHKFIRFITSSS